MIYTTGTIAISGNTLTGTGTNFTAAGSLIRNGCTVIALTSPAQVFQITAIGGATSLTVTPAASPAIPAGTKYSILLSDSLSVDGLAQDIAETFTMYQRYMSGFADVMNGTTDVTITINGVAVTVPGQKSLAKKGANSDITSLSGLTTALSVGQGGTGAKNAADARTNLGLGSSATKDVGTASGNVMQVGGFGLGLTNLNAASITNANDILFNGFSSGGGSSSINFFDQYAGLISVTRSGGGDGKGFAGQLQIGGGGALAVRGMGLSTWSSWMQAYTTGNTTKASDGTLKAASPVARIVKSQEENQRTEIAEDGFSWCGCATANEEAEGVHVSRIDVGVYTLTGSAGLASSGWQLLPPMDPGGMGELGIVEAMKGDGGVLTIRLFKRKYILSEDGEMVKSKGVPIDVPLNSWIDVRLDMPEDSIWKTKSSQASMADVDSNPE